MQSKRSLNSPAHQVIKSDAEESDNLLIKAQDLHQKHRDDDAFEFYVKYLKHCNDLDSKVKTNYITQILLGLTREAKNNVKVSESDVKRNTVIGNSNSIVYQGTFKGKIAAIKDMDTSQQSDYSCEREINIMHLLKKVGMPHAVKFYGFSTSLEMYTIMMEFAVNGSLSNHLNTLRSDQQEQYTLEIAIAVEFLHGFNIIHGDIKPDNIVLTESGSKLCDFGHSDIEGSIHCGGTPAFLAPEYLRRTQVQPTLNSKPADIYSLALTFQCLFARNPVPYASIILPDDDWAAKCLDLVVEKDKRDPIPLACREDVKYVLTHGLLGNPFKRPTAHAIVAKLQEKATEVALQIK